MKHLLLAFIALAALCGCSSFDTLNGLDNSEVTCVPAETSNETENDRFAILIENVCKDRNLLSRRSRDWNYGEGAFGLATLAAASYGAFNTTYGGNNLKDAAFAAASIVSLRGLVDPVKNRTAHAKAAARLNCLYEKASRFEGDFQPFGHSVFAENLNTTIQTKSRSSTSSFSLLNMPLSSMGITGNQLNRLNASGVPQIFAVTLSKSEDAYNQRFMLVSKTYFAIIAMLHEDTKFTAGTFNSLLEEYKAAVKDTAKAEVNAEAITSESFAALQTTTHAFAIEALAEAATGYTKAREELLACATLNAS